ncbi:MAG: tripartite tricarboxylate transporter substrate binding protein [Proteobacteria bacterium]|nr:tripartite tricarboxylate transporter substrate binding protein [Pseudomonadota bacterium]
MKPTNAWTRKTSETMRGLSMAAAVLGVAAMFAGGATAQQYPAKNITAIVPFAAGGGADTQTRIWGGAIAPIIGHRIIVENNGAAAGIPGTKQGIAADPDGYTVLIGVASTIAINPFTNKAANYKPLEDLKAVAMIGYTPYVLVVANNLNIKTFPDLMKYGKDNPGKLTFASWTSVGNLARQGLELRSGLAMTLVPYKGSVDAINDVVAGRASATIADSGSIMPFIKAGSVTPIAITTGQKSTSLPDVPTIDELGVKNYVIDSWVAMFVPKKTPDEVVEFLNKKTREALKTKNVQDRYAEVAIETLDLNAAETQAFMERQTKNWKSLVEQVAAK